MAQFGVQKNEYKVLKPKPNYEFIVTNIEEVANDRGQFAYKEGDDPKKATKFEWTFKGRPNTEADGVVIRKRTPAYLTTDQRNGWLQFSAAVDPDFDSKTGYASEADLKKRCENRPVMLAISNTTKTVNGEERTYNNIDKPYPSSMPALDAVDYLSLIAESVTTIDGSSEEIPF